MSVYSGVSVCQDEESTIILESGFSVSFLRLSSRSCTELDKIKVIKNIEKIKSIFLPHAIS